MTVTTPTVTDTQPATRAYHWVLTVQWPSYSGFSMTTMWGTATAQEGTSRTVMFNTLIDQAAEKTGVEKTRLMVMCFTLEPDQMEV
jgi:hypothetical protein